jgi:hypothetical protein
MKTDIDVCVLCNDLNKYLKIITYKKLKIINKLIYLIKYITLSVNQVILMLNLYLIKYIKLSVNQVIFANKLDMCSNV